MKKNNDISGLLVVDKPAGPTSHDIVAQTRRKLQTRRVGHAGTLDPMATGILILGVGRATKLLTFIVGSDKEYVATVRLGIGTITDDAEGDVTSAPGFVLSDGVALDRAIDAFRGEIMQVPSAVSAIKVAGERAYSRIRAGETVELAARPITISAFEILGVPRAVTVDSGKVECVDVDVRVKCSSGTYIRALARDLGKELGTAGHLTSLRRTSVGPFTLNEVSDELLSVEEACAKLYPVQIEVDARAAERFTHGVAPKPDSDSSVDGGLEIACVTHNGEVLGLVKVERGRLKPAFIINPS